MRTRPIALLVAVVILAALAPSTTMADIINVDTMFAANGRSIWRDGAGFTFDTGSRFIGIGPWDKGDKVGGVESICPPFLPCANFGVELGAKTTGKIGIGYGLKVDSGTFDIHYPLRAKFDVPSVAYGEPHTPPTVRIDTALIGLTGAFLPNHPGETVTIRTPTLQVRAPDLQAFVDLGAELTAFAGARACLGICLGPALGPFGFNESKEIAAINRGGDGQIRVLGETLVSAHESITGLNGHLIANFNLPRLDSSSAGGGFDGFTLTSAKRDSVAVLRANIAQIGADAVGLPIPLSGQYGGFGYNLLQATAGVTIDVEQRLDFTPSARGKLVFSSDVVPQIGGVDQAPTRVIDFELGQPVTFTPTLVGAIGVEPIITLGGKVRNRINAVLGGEVKVRAMGVSIDAGRLGRLTLGPLIDEGLGTGDLGTINVFDRDFDTILGTVMGQPFNLNLPGCVATFGGNETDPREGVCPISGYGGGGSFMDSDGFLERELSAFGCLGAAFADGPPSCFELPIGFTSPYLPSPFGGDLFLGSADARNFDPVVPGPSTTDESQSRALASLGGASDEPFIIPPGDPLTAFLPVPVPATVVLLGLGFAGLLAGRASRLTVTRERAPRLRWRFRA